MPIETKRIKFPGASGDHLAARLERPEEQPACYALFAHCFTCSKDLKSVRVISRKLAEKSIAVMRFDFTGLGESEGDFAETNFRSNLEDLVAAADYLREHHEAPRLLIGHSLGGAAVLAAAHRIEECRAVATIGAPSSTQHLRDNLAAQAPELLEQDEAEVELAGRTIRLRRQLLEDLADHQVQEAVANLGRSLLIFHSPVDTVVGIEHARRLYEAARHPKSFLSLDQADHLLLSDDRDAELVGEVLAAWARRVATDS